MAGMTKRSTFWLGWSLALALVAVFASLGRWQLSRMDEKQAMLDQVAATLADRRPLPLAAAAEPGRARDFDWAQGEGRFLDAPAVLLDNQQRDGRPGVRVYRAFAPESGTPLLVELGWLPLPGDRTMPAPERIDGEQRIQGLLAPPPSAGLAQGLSAATAGGDVLAVRLDAPSLPARLGLDALPPRVLKLDPALPIGHARDLDVLPNTLPPQKHLGYAVQWFGLAAAAFVTALVLTVRSRR